MEQAGPDPAMRCVAWRTDAAWLATEWCRLVETRAGVDLSGCVVGAHGGSPLRIDYAIGCDGGWRTRTVDVSASHGASTIHVRLACERGRWQRDGAAAPELDDALDIDLGFSPSTNTLPIRRLSLGVGEGARIRVAWVRFPAFDVVRTEQSYTRLESATYGFASGSYRAEIGVDDAGLVTDYDEWTRIGAVPAGGPRD